ncbi:hypothetical protein GZH49_29340 [Nocardia terpenica]|uniref:hypothetical protein n=1 Tax=Nocardia terpenica TaxID=455432 RepID=UPI002FE3D175
MGTPNFNYGQSEIKVFSDAASGGVLHFDEKAVQDAVRQYDLMIEGLYKVREKLGQLTFVSGFGGFQSSLELQDGFSRKAQDGIAIINQLIDGAMQLQEAYLRSAGLMKDADRNNANRLKFIANTARADGVKQ